RYRTQRLGANLEIRIGNPDAYVTGLHVYRIVYRVKRAVLYFEDHDEIYWNATGSEWPVGIASASARVVLPAGASGENANPACYTGPQGDTATDCSAVAEGGSVLFRSTRPLGPQEGMTVAVGIAKGILMQPTKLSRFLDRVGDAVSAWILIPFAVLTGMIHFWRTRGRDPAGGEALPVRYEPPDDLRPAEVGTILDERANLEDLTATILDLAVRDRLEIEEIAETKFLFFSSKDYRLHKRGTDDADLRPFERKMITALFGGKKSVLVSSLRNEFYKDLPEIKKALYSGLSGRGKYFPASPDSVRLRYFIIGVVVAAVGFILIGPAGIGFAPGVSVFLAGVVIAAFAPFMPRRTALGRRAEEEIRGFKEFVERVDAERLDRMGGRTAERFERILPYAIVLGMADAWAGAFADIYREPPRWYRGYGAQSFHPGTFVSDVGQSMKTIGSTMASSPRGSGGGSGGGGSSGGGFGGGGGGSW
ncbi:MAG: DUF2207 domain-containing protein, partial [Deltaproteobacteria bacterium]|nr:DUF2207 domain-containing protein [Deltaproteobacteria bacterium]